MVLKDVNGYKCSCRLRYTGMRGGRVGFCTSDQLAKPGPPEEPPPMTYETKDRAHDRAHVDQCVDAVEPRACRLPSRSDSDAVSRMFTDVQVCSCVSSPSRWASRAQSRSAMRGRRGVVRQVTRGGARLSPVRRPASVSVSTTLGSPRERSRTTSRSIVSSPGNVSWDGRNSF